jgi:hypothetical protein
MNAWLDKSEKKFSLPQGCIIETHHASCVFDKLLLIIAGAIGQGHRVNL